jgi:hypothetical protein
VAREGPLVVKLSTCFEQRESTQADREFEVARSALGRFTINSF